MEKKNYELSNTQSQKKEVKPVKVVKYYINAANCNALSMMQYVRYMRNFHNQCTAICQQTICVNTEVEHLCDSIIYHYPTFVYFFCKYNARNRARNGYGRMEDCLPFHSSNLPFYSILASSIFHTEISVPFHFPFHSISCPVYKDGRKLHTYGFGGSQSRDFTFKS